jgi:hypothetical protein
MRGRYWFLTGAALLAGLNACDTSSPTAGIDRGGVRTPVSAHGAITGFGSIVVNGVHYSLDAATVRIDGALAAEADLELGQVVTISANREAGVDGATAETVTVTSNVQGPVTAIDAAAYSFSVLGQTVRARADTVFELGGRAPAVGSLIVGETLRVSGFVAADGSIEAARVEERAANVELRVSGKVERLSRSAARFDINALTVSYSSAAVIEGFPTGEPSEGDEVVVTGRAVASNGTLLAATLERRRGEVGVRAGDEFEIEGLITRFVSPQDFDVAGVAVTTTPATRYEHGSPSSLALDLKVHVSGRVNGALQREASKVEIED